MSTEQKSAPVSDHPRDPSRGQKWWVVALVGLVALGLGFGVGYLVSERTATDAARGDVPAEVVDRAILVLDAYKTASNAGDVEASLALFTDEFVWEGKTVETSRARLIEQLGGYGEGTEWEFVGDPLVVPAWNMANAYDVSVKWVEWDTPAEGADADRITWRAEGITTYRLVDKDGALKIHRFYPSPDWFEE